MRRTVGVVVALLTLSGRNGVGGPVVRGGTAFVSSGGNLRAFTDCGHADCAPSWSGSHAGDSQSAQVVAAGDLVFVASATGANSSVVSIYPADGCGQTICESIKSLPLTGQVKSLLVTGGRLVVVMHFSIHAFGLAPQS